MKCAYKNLQDRDALSMAWFILKYRPSKEPKSLSWNEVVL